MSIKTVSDITDFASQVQSTLERVLVNQSQLVELYLTALLSGGHLLLIGPPGIAKTRSANAFSNLLSLSFRRIQFTPDLLPADILWAEIFNPKSGNFLVKEGPIFSDFVLADELNRAPAKVQSALLEAMQERQVTIAGETKQLPEVFSVVATMNMLDGQWTYPLPEAALDRFALSMELELPSFETEKHILSLTLAEKQETVLEPFVTVSDILEARQVVRSVHVSDDILSYIARLISESRSEEFSPFLSGISPRASIALLKAAQVRAVLQGRDYVIPEDVKALAENVLSHRIHLTYHAEAEGKTKAEILDSLFSKTPVATLHA